LALKWKSLVLVLALASAALIQVKPRPLPDFHLSDHCISKNSVICLFPLLQFYMGELVVVLLLIQTKNSFLGFPVFVVLILESLSVPNLKCLAKPCKLDV
jgi:hypothetical protein